MRLVRTVIALVVVAAFAASANAAYQGRNGQIAFSQPGSGGVAVYSASPNGGNLTQLTTDPSFNASPAYSADGRRIAFCSDRTKGRFEIFVMQADGTGQRQLTHMNGNATFPDFSPSGSRIVFAGYRSGGSKDDVWVMTASGSGLRRLTAGAGNNDQPVWSPDGSEIAFTSDRTGVEQIWVMRADGTHQTQLTTDHVVHVGVDWSPDGRKLVYDDGNPGTPTAIWVMNADGTGKHRLTYGSNRDFGPAWSPDGKEIAFVRVLGFTQHAEQDVYVMSADGKHQHTLHKGGKQLEPAWQPVVGAS